MKFECSEKKEDFRLSLVLVQPCNTESDLQGAALSTFREPDNKVIRSVVLIRPSFQCGGEERECAVAGREGIKGVEGV